MLNYFIKIAITERCFSQKLIVRDEIALTKKTYLFTITASRYLVSTMVWWCNCFSKCCWLSWYYKFYSLSLDVNWIFGFEPNKLLKGIFNGGVIEEKLMLTGYQYHPIWPRWTIFTKKYHTYLLLKHLNCYSIILWKWYARMLLVYISSFQLTILTIH